MSTVSEFEITDIWTGNKAGAASSDVAFTAPVPRGSLPNNLGNLWSHKLGCPHLTAAGGMGRCTCEPHQKGDAK